MNWKLVVLLSLTGIVMGVAATFGLTREFEPFLWLIIAVVTAIVLASHRVPKPFFHGLMVGLFAAVLAATIEAIFMPTYLANNPEAASEFAKSPINPRLLIFGMSPIVGAIFGTITGVFAWLAGRWVFRR